MTSISSKLGRVIPSSFRSSIAGPVKEDGRVAGLPTWNIWLVMALFGIAISMVEVIDHNRMHVAHGTGQLILQDVELIREIVMYGIMLPVMGALLLTVLNRRGAERDLAEKELDRQRAFAEEIHEIVDWSELTERITRFPGTILPAVRSQLTVFDLDDHHSELVASWSADEGHLAERDSMLAYQSCQRCLNATSGEAHVVLPCERVDDSAWQEGRVRYCLPLALSNELLAILNFELADGQQLANYQRRMLLGYAPQMASAIENVQLQRSKLSLTEVAAAERRRVARNLHDTLAQNITYLRLKLDQLSAQDGSLQDFAAIQHEIERMRSVADEAYVQMRETLLGLRSDSQGDITDALIGLADTMQARTSLKIRVKSHGSPLSLPPFTQRQAVYVCREAINNALKHAEAELVRIELMWGAADLTITVSDNGRGFHPEDEFHRRGYGLNIMQERATALGGKLAVESAPNTGTTVALFLPVPANK